MLMIDTFLDPAANEKRYKDVYCRCNIAGVATLCDDSAILLSTIAYQRSKNIPRVFES